MTYAAKTPLPVSDSAEAIVHQVDRVNDDRVIGGSGVDAPLLESVAGLAEGDASTRNPAAAVARAMTLSVRDLLRPRRRFASTLPYRPARVILTTEQIGRAHV